MNTSRLSGIIPAVPTPFFRDGDPDLDALRFNLTKLADVPLSGYVIGGSNGEFVYLSAVERQEVVRVAREVVPADRMLIVGTGMESTRATIEMTALMAEEGAEAALVVCPNYFTNQMTAEALTIHYLAVAEASPIPVVLYSVPANTGFDLPLESVIQLAPHANIIGMKDSGGNITRIGSIVHRTPGGFSMLAGSAGFFLAGLAVGCVGTICALANVAGRELSLIQEEFLRGEIESARQRQGRLIEPNWTLTARFGVSGLKFALDLVGFKGGFARSPLQPLKEEEKAEVRRALEEAGLL